MRAVVSGRLVNVHSENDLVLAFMYRSAHLELGVAGLQAVEGVKGIENVDVSDIVSGHLRYRFLSGSILKRIGFEDLDVKRVEEEESQMKAMEELEEQERRAHEQMDSKEGKDDDEQLKELEKDVEKRNQESMMDWAMTQMKLGKGAIESLWSGKGDADHDKDKHTQDKPKQ